MNLMLEYKGVAYNELVFIRVKVASHNRVKLNSGKTYMLSCFPRQCLWFSMNLMTFEYAFINKDNLVGCVFRLIQ